MVFNSLCRTTVLSPGLQLVGPIPFDPGFPISTSVAMISRCSLSVKASNNPKNQLLQPDYVLASALRRGWVATSRCALGFEGAGYPNPDDVTLPNLLPRIVDAIQIPVIACGGIADRHQFLAARLGRDLPQAPVYRGKSITSFQDHIVGGTR
jgi:hypothetical protein